MEILNRNVVTDYGELNAMIFVSVCPVCESTFEYGMAYIENPPGYYPLMVNNCRTWEAGEDVEYKIDMSEKVHATYSGAYLYCSVLCEKILYYYVVKERNIKNSTRRRKERRDAARALRPDPICKCCNKTFKSKRSDAKYCSDRCRQKAHRNK